MSIFLDAFIVGVGACLGSVLVALASDACIRHALGGLCVE